MGTRSAKEAFTRDVVFVSYSHADRDWLERLRPILKGYAWYERVWADPRIDAGEVWHDRIAEAIGRARVAVLLVSYHFEASDFIQAHELPILLEAAAAGRLALVIIPVRRSSLAKEPFLRLKAIQWAGDPERPLNALAEHEWEHALILAAREIDRHVGDLVAANQEPREPRPAPRAGARPKRRAHAAASGALFGVSGRPARVLQLDAYRAIKRLVLDTSSSVVGVTSVAQRVGLHGQGGVGKTTLVRALVEDADVRRAFPDGLFWLTVGQRPDALGIQGQLLAWIGERGTFTTLADTRDALRRTLETKQALVVLDDVWNVRDAKAFDVLGPRSRMLVTTRDGSMLSALGAAQHRLETLTPEQSLHLFSDVIGVPVKDLPSAAATTARACGHLPLALAVIGAMVRDGAPWTEVLEALRAGDLRYLDHPSGSVFASLSLSVGRLSKAAAERYRELAVFPEDVDVPQTTIAQLWKQTARLSAAKTKTLLKTLARQNLLELRESGGQAFVGMHDLLHDYVRLTAPSLTALHAHLVDAVASALPHASSGGTEWSALPTTEQYLWLHLPHHFLQGGKADELRAELLNELWLRRKIEAIGIAAVLDDLRCFEGDAEIDQVAGALRLAAQIVANDPSQLPSQLWGRIADRTSPGLRHLLASAGRELRGPWLRPVRPTLTVAGGPLRLVLSHPEPVIGVAVTPDGTQIVSGGGFQVDYTVHVWDRASGALVHRFAGHTAAIFDVAVTPDGAQLVSGGCDNTVRVWDRKTGELLQTLEGHTRWVRCLTVTPDGEYIISGADDCTVGIWHRATGTLRLKLDGHQGCISAVLATPDGRKIVSGTGKGELLVWDSMTGAPLRVLQGCSGWVKALAVTSDSNFLVCASGRLQIWNLRTGALAHTLDESDETVGVSVTPNGQELVCVASNGRTRIWSFATGRWRPVGGPPVDRVGKAVLTPDGREVVLLDVDEGVVQVRAIDWPDLDQEQESQGDFICGLVSTHGSLVSFDLSGNVRIWNAETGALDRSFQDHGDAFCLTVSSDERHFVTGGVDGTVRVYDLATGALCRTCRSADEDGNTIYAVTTTRRGQHVIVGDETGAVYVRSLNTGRVRPRFQAHSRWVNSLAITPDDLHIVSASADGTLRIFARRGDSDFVTLEGHTNAVTAVAITPDGEHVVSAGEDRTIRVWDRWSGQLRRTIEGHDASIETVAIAPDGSYIVSGSADHTVRVWNFADGTLRATYGVDTLVQRCAVSASPLRIVAGGRDGSIHILAWETGAAGEQAL